MGADPMEHPRVDKYRGYSDTDGMRTALTREERRTQTRAELLDAAERLFSEQGFHATSVDQVADDAGYTKGAVYSNFVSKEDLFFAVYERRVDRALPHLEAAFAESRTAIEGLERITAAWPPAAAPRTDGSRSSSSSGRTFCAMRSCASGSPNSTVDCSTSSSPRWSVQLRSRARPSRRNRASWPPRVTRCSSASSSSA